MARAQNAAAGALAAAILLAPSLARADDPGLLAIGAGAIDFDHKQPAAEFRAEYRFAQGFYFIKPIAGVLGTTRGSVYVYGGLRADFIFAQHYVLMPVAAVGYFDRGNGKDLGSHTEFKTGVEFAYRFDNAARVGLAFDHISNAGITRVNPGTESLMVMVSLPLGW
jgi:lipid A 3-O-deacylase